VEFRSLKRTGLWHNGVRRSDGLLSPGDVLRIGEQLILYATRRRVPMLPAPVRGFSASFGFPDPFGIVGESPAMCSLRGEIGRAAASGEHTLLVGPSGSGKELLARAFHGLASRPGGAFVARNATTLPQSLIDAELFGNVKNYPNPGTPERQGLVGAADKGTLFLDEIGELVPDAQAHLLRVLDAGGEYHRLGDATARHSDFRLIAATNRDPEALKPDLLARLPVRIQVPGLAERREDIPLLIQHLLSDMAERDAGLAPRFAEPNRNRGRVFRVAPTLLEELLLSDHSLNVRELRELLYGSIGASSSHFLDSVPPASGPRSVGSSGPAAPTTFQPGDPMPEAVKRALGRSGGNVAAAARELGLSSRFVLHRLMQKYGVSRSG